MPKSEGDNRGRVESSARISYIQGIYDSLYNAQLRADVFNGNKDQQPGDIQAIALREEELTPPTPIEAYFSRLIAQSVTLYRAVRGESDDDDDSSIYYPHVVLIDDAVSTRLFSKSKKEKIAAFPEFGVLAIQHSWLLNVWADFCQRAKAGDGTVAADVQNLENQFVHVYTDFLLNVNRMYAWNDQGLRAGIYTITYQGNPDKITDIRSKIQKSNVFGMKVPELEMWTIHGQPSTQNDALEGQLFNDAIVDEVVSYVIEYLLNEPLSDNNPEVKNIVLTQGGSMLAHLHFLDGDKYAQLQQRMPYLKIHRLAPFLRIEPEQYQAIVKDTIKVSDGTGKKPNMVPDPVSLPVIDAFSKGDPQAFIFDLSARERNNVVKKADRPDFKLAYEVFSFFTLCSLLEPQFYQEVLQHVVKNDVSVGERLEELSRQLASDEQGKWQMLRQYMDRFEEAILCPDKTDKIKKLQRLRQSMTQPAFIVFIDLATGRYQRRTKWWEKK